MEGCAEQLVDGQVLKPLFFLAPALKGFPARIERWALREPERQPLLPALEFSIFLDSPAPLNRGGLVVWIPAPSGVSESLRQRLQLPPAQESAGTQQQIYQCRRMPSLRPSGLFRL